MDFSLWDLCDGFRLHEAACLIAGVQPLSKRVPDREELPPEAIPIYVKLGSAYVLNWVAHNRDLPQDPKHPIESMLKASPLEGSGIPTLPEIEPLKRLTGEFVSREELHRWIAVMGINSAYSFAPVTPSTVGGEPDIPPTPPAPVGIDDDGTAPATKEQRQDRRLKACEVAGLNFKNYNGRLPDGVGKVANTEGVKRQPFSVDVKAALERRKSAKREGVIVRRA